MKFITKPLVLACILAGGLTACQENKPMGRSVTNTAISQQTTKEAPADSKEVQADNSEKSTCSTPPMAVTSSTYEYQLPPDIAKQCQKNNNCPSVDVSLINTGRAWIDNTINYGDPNITPQAGIAKLKQSLDEEVQDYYMADSGSGGYGYENRSEYHSCYKHLEQFVEHTYVYTGGAHGMYADSFYVFDIKNKKRLKLSDVAPNLTALEPLAKEAYDDYNRELDMYEARRDAVVELNDDWQFYFAPDGLVLVANPYELGTFAEGIIELKIPYGKLSGVVDKKYLP